VESRNSGKRDQFATGVSLRSSRLFLATFAVKGFFRMPKKTPKKKL
jgi:hypothetical protein